MRVGRAGPGEGPGEGPEREGESQVLNSIVVEALAGVCESVSKIECNLEFWTPPDQISRNIVYNIVFDMQYVDENV